MPKILLTTVLTLAVSVPAVVSAEQTSNMNGAIPINFASHVKNDLSQEAISKITSQLGPNATGVTIVDAAPSVRDIRPSGDQCFEGYSFDGRPLVQYKFKLGREGTHYINRTSENVPWTSTITETATISGEVNGEGKWSAWGAIEAKVGFKIGGSYSWTTTESSVITVKPGNEGWNDYGTINDVWTGYHVYVNYDCTTRDGKYISVDGPRYKTVIGRERKANI